MKALTPLDEHDPLVLVARMFRPWRYHGGTRHPVPAPFQRIACLVCQWHPLDQVAYELGLSVATLRRWYPDDSTSGIVEPERGDLSMASFVPLSMVDEAAAAPLPVPAP